MKWKRATEERTIDGAKVQTMTKQNKMIIQIITNLK